MHWEVVKQGRILRSVIHREGVKGDRETRQSQGLEKRGGEYQDTPNWVKEKSHAFGVQTTDHVTTNNAILVYMFVCVCVYVCVVCIRVVAALGRPALEQCT